MYIYVQYMYVYIHTHEVYNIKCESKPPESQSSKRTTSVGYFSNPMQRHSQGTPCHDRLTRICRMECKSAVSRSGYRRQNPPIRAAMAQFSGN